MDMIGFFLFLFSIVAVVVLAFYGLYLVLREAVRNIKRWLFPAKVEDNKWTKR